MNYFIYIIFANGLNNTYMVKDKRFIIGIAGVKQSGKDTVSSMLSYIISNGTYNAKFNTWLTKYSCNNYISDDNRVIHFADYLKEILSKMFRIDIKCFYNVFYKDNVYYTVDKEMFIDDINKLKNYKILTVDDFAVAPLTKWCKESNGRVCFNLRTLMQYFATDICRNMINEDCWVNATMCNAIDIRNKYGFCLIPDVRFANEANAIKRQPNGYIIQINRNINSGDNHQSELLLDIEPDFVIDNNSTKFNLFHDVVAIVEKIYGL